MKSLLLIVEVLAYFLIIASESENYVLECITGIVSDIYVLPNLTDLLVYGDGYIDYYCGYLISFFTKNLCFCCYGDIIYFLVAVNGRSIDFLGLYYF